MISIRHQRRAVMATAALVAGVTALSGVTSNAATAPQAAQRHTDARTASQGEHRGHYDIRTAGGAAGQAARLRAAADRSPSGAISARARSGVGGALLDLDPLTSTPRMLGKLDGFLTGKSDKKPTRVALNYVSDHAAAIGLRSQDVKSFVFRDDYTDIAGTHHLSWTQKFGDIEIFSFGLQAAVDKKGRLLMIGGSPVPSRLIGRTAPARALTSPGQAIAAAHRSNGESARTLRGDVAKRVLFFAGGRTYQGWQITSVSGDNPATSVLDASSGKLLFRRPFTQDERGEAARKATDSTGRVFEGYSTDPYVDVNFTQRGWLDQDAETLNGNNSHAFSDVDDDNVADPGEEVGPSAGAAWNYEMQGFDLSHIPGMDEYCDNPFKCSWDPEEPNSWETNREQNTTQVFFFVNNWHDVLEAAPYGFTEDAGNFQMENPSGNGFGDDAVETNTLDGADTNGGLPDGQHIDNANMSTPPDGTAPTMQMYLQHQPGLDYSFDGDPFPANNTGDEADTVYHEYTHGLSNRLVIDPGGESGLGPVQAGAMGEAWGDFYALSYLVKQGLRTDAPGAGDMWLGLADGIGRFLVRTEPMDCPVGDGGGECAGGETGHDGGYTYADYGHVIGSPEVHADGEIWGQTLWDLRSELGYNKTMGLVTRAMELSPYDPSMLDERNALLMADTVVYGGKNHKAIWKVFAHRGMGYYAGALGGEDSQPGASFDTPPPGKAKTAKITGKVVDSVTGKPVKHAPVTLAWQGDNATVNPTTTTNKKGRYTLGPVPVGKYPKLLVNGGGGYVPVIKSVNVKAKGGSRDFAVVRDWAAQSGGAGIADFNGPDYSPDCGPEGAIDLSQATGWGSTTGGDDAPLTNVFVPKFIVVELPQAIDITTIGVDPSATCGDGGSASTGDYSIETSPDGDTWTEAVSGSFTVDDRGRINMLDPAAGADGVKFVRFNILGNQTPNFETNCPDGAYSGCQFTDMTELQVFGGPAS